MSTEIIVALISGGGLTLLLKAVGGGMWKWLTGRQEAEKVAFQEMAAERRYSAELLEQLYFMRNQLMQKGHPLLPLVPERRPYEPDSEQ